MIDIKNKSVQDTVAENAQIENKEIFGKLLDAHLSADKAEHNIVQGTILMVRNGMVIIDVGLKSEGAIPIKEFTVRGKQEMELEPGTVIEVYIERLEGRGGRMLLSREKARREGAWHKFLELYSQGVEVEGEIIGRVKGGFAVDLGSITAFLPGSQIDFRPIKDIGPMLYVTQLFKILKMDENQGNIVVSRKAIIEKSQVKDRDAVLSQIKEGMTLKGIVKNMTHYGAFISISPLVDGLLHITDISWKKIEHPSEILSLNQEVEVMVIKYNEETQRVSLGLKQLDKNPWINVSSKYPVGSKVTGTITSILDYGAFVALDGSDDGKKGTKIEGLVYHTEIAWGTKNVNPRSILNIGDKVEVIVLEIDEEKNRMSLSIKQCKDNPWENFITNHPIGTVITGKVKNILSFGMFLTVQHGNDEPIDALVPVKEMSWDSNPENELKKYKVGDEVTGIILTVDLEKEKVIIGLKQNTQDNFTQISEKLKRGDVVTCTVTEIRNDGIEVELLEGLRTFIKKTDISKHKSEQRPQRFNVGDRLDAKIVSLDRVSRNIAISIRALEIDEERKAIEAYGDVSSGATLGEILGTDFMGDLQSKKDKS